MWQGEFDFGCESESKAAKSESSGKSPIIILGESRSEL